MLNVQTIKTNILAISILILASVIYFKPVANRYTFTKGISSDLLTYNIYDTATGKIYDYSNFVDSGYEHIFVIDIINNKQYSKDVTPTRFQFLKQRTERAKVK